MKIIKRNGSEAVFDITKIIAAITKANKVVPDAQRLTKQQIIEISDHVQEVCYARGHAMNVEEIQDIVEDAIMATGAYEVARRYITYRYVQSLKRTHNTTDDKILSLIECNNEEVKQENSNKNPTVNSVQRDYMAGEVSKDLTMRMLLPPEIVKAHEEGIIHFHDADYYAQQRKPIDVTGGQTLQYFIANFLGKRRTVAEIPCHGIEAVRAVAAAAGNEQARAHALPVGNITIFNGCVIHGVLLRGHPHILCRAGVPPPNPDIVYQLWGHTARGSMIFEEDI